MSALDLDGIGHAYFGRTTLDGVSLAIRPAEIVALVGPSGCGKSTLVHIACGLIEPLRGRVRRHYRRHAMVFQEPRLLPWASALDNIAYPLRLSGMGAAERRERARAAAGSVSLEAADLGNSRRSCRAACASAPPSPARLPSSRTSCSSTSPSPRSMSR